MVNKKSVITWDHVKIAMAIAILSPPVAFVVSYCYDWGFFHTLGISYSDAPSSITDHLRTGLVWLPIAILLFVGFATLELLTIRLGRGRSEEEVNHIAVRPKRFGIELQVVCIGIGVFGLLWVVIWFQFGDVSTISLLILGLSLGWSSLTLWITAHPLVQNRLSDLSSVIYIVWPFIPLLFVFFGQVQANSVFGNRQPNNRIHISDNSSPSELEVDILRTYGDWLLVNNKQDKIYWIKLGNVDRIEVLNKKGL